MSSTSELPSLLIFWLASISMQPLIDTNNAIIKVVIIGILFHDCFILMVSLLILAYPALTGTGLQKVKADPRWLVQGNNCIKTSDAHCHA